MNIKKLLLIPCVLFISACGPTSNPTSDPTIDPTVEPTLDPTTEEPAAKNIDVIVLAGQSNMEGHSHISELKKHISDDKYHEYVDGYDEIKMTYKEGCYGSNNNSNYEFRKVRLGQGCNTSMFGPELGMAEYFHEYKDTLANEVVFVKFAVGGTSIYKEWRSPSSVTGSFEKGYLYSPFVNYVHKSMNNLIEAGYNPVLKAICWMQGESDGQYAQEYENLEHNFITDVVTDLADYNDETIKFIDAGIYDSSWVGNPALINKSKIKNVDKDPDNRFYFDTIEANLEYRNEPEGNPDLFHFDSESMIELGKLFASTIFENAII